MRKYISILKMSFRDSFKYISAVLLKFITYFLNIFVLSSIWKYIYDDPNKLINGYSLTQMIWYLLIAETITYSSSDISISEINSDIASGEIAYKVNKPFHYIGYNFTRYIGDGIIKFVLYTIVSITIGLLVIGPISLNISLINIPCIALCVILAVSINGLIKIAIALLSFWVVDSNPFYWIYKKLLLLFGIFFPIEMFPKVLRPIIKCTPVFVAVYGPVKLILHFSMDFFYKLLFAQIIYLIIVLLITTILYKKGVKKLNVNGG